MNAVPGTLAAGGAPFCSTRWSVVRLAAQSQSDQAAREAMAAICRDYWPPLYAFVRRRGRSPSDAQDCVQGFFAHLLEANTLSRVSREKGRLRTFLLGSLQHFLAKERERAGALKRGGGQQVVPLDDHLVEAEAAVAAGGSGDETCCYDHLWAATLVRRAWDSLLAAAREEGRGALVEALRPFFFVGTVAPPSQEETAARLGMPVATLRTHLHRLRARYREALREQVAHTVSNAAEVDGEMSYLFRVLSA